MMFDKLKSAKHALNNFDNVEKKLGLATSEIDRLRAEITALNKQSKQLEGIVNSRNDPLNDSEYEILSNPLFSISQNELDLSKTSTGLLVSNPESALWFIPLFNHISYGGIYTIMRTANMMAEKGVRISIVLYSKEDEEPSDYKDIIMKEFPALIDSNIIMFNTSKDNVESLPSADIGLCTLWNSAYLLLRYNQTKDKYYFIQDYEPMFFAAGATYALVESTYRFGFKGIVNTPGLEKSIKEQYGMKTISFIPTIDKRYYYFDKSQKNTDGIVRIFFYARPSKERNAFSLGREVILRLKDKYGDKIEVITAGADWNERKYGLDGKLTNLGLLNGLEEVGKLYRSCDISFSFMLSKHPSYQPFELMASGVAYVTNTNEHNEWFLKDKVNSLVCEPSPLLIYQNVSKFIDDKQFRDSIVETAIDSVPMKTWDDVTDDIWNKMKIIR